MKLSSEEFDVCKLEWAQCEEGIARFDALNLQIKGLAVSVFGILAAAAFTLHRREIIMIAVLTTFFCWIIDALHKSYQVIFIDRSNVVQILIRNHLEDNVEISDRSTPLIGRNFKEYFSRKITRQIGNICHFATFPNVLLLYAALLVSDGVAFFLVPWGGPSDPLRDAIYVVIALHRP